MTPEEFQRIRQLFLAASKKTPEERGRFLDEACGEHREVRARVEAMLSHDVESSAEARLQAADFLETPSPPADPDDVPRGRLR